MEGVSRGPAIVAMLRRHWLEIALLLASLAFTANDWSVRPDLWVEAVGRIAMAFLAAFLLFVDEADPVVPWLVGCLIGFSFDVYWQTTDAYGPGPLQWWAMAIKYAGVGAGLGALLHVCGSYREPEGRTLRRAFGRAGVAAGIVVALVGWTHGALWIAQYRGCALDPRCEGFAMAAYRAYLAVDVLVRMAAVCAVGIGIATLRGDDRRRLQFIAIAATLFGIGTLVHFTALFLPQGDGWGNWPDYLDQFTTLLFPLFVAIAIVRRDINFVLNKTLASGTVVTALAVAWGVLEQIVHMYLEDQVKRHGVNLEEVEKPAGAVLAGMLALAFKPLEERVGESVGKIIDPDRSERLEMLRKGADEVALCSTIKELRTPLRRAIARGLHADFALFVLAGSDEYVRRIESDGASPDPAVVRLTANRKATLGKGTRLRLEGGIDATFGKACLVVPMIAAGRLCGLLACWPRKGDDCFEPDEVRELVLLSRCAAAVIAAEPPRPASLSTTPGSSGAERRAV
jgi:hypothetical protein